MYLSRILRHLNSSFILDKFTWKGVMNYHYLYFFCNFNFILNYSLFQKFDKYFVIFGHFVVGIKFIFGILEIKILIYLFGFS